MPRAVSNCCWMGIFCHCRLNSSSLLFSEAISPAQEAGRTLTWSYLVWIHIYNLDNLAVTINEIKIIWRCRKTRVRFRKHWCRRWSSVCIAASMESPSYYNYYLGHATSAMDIDHHWCKVQWIKTRVMKFPLGMMWTKDKLGIPLWFFAKNIHMTVSIWKLQYDLNRISTKKVLRMLITSTRKLPA